MAMADSTQPSEEGNADPKIEQKRARHRIYSKRYRQRHPGRKKESNRRYRERNPESVAESVRKCIAKDPERYRLAAAAKARASRKRFSEKHGAAYTTVRARTDPLFRLLRDIRKRLFMALKQARASKSGRTISMIGCSLPYLRQHLEAQFVDGMSWDNRDQWHIDHIIPLSRFDLSDPEQQAAALHYTNLQPLWASENLRKKDRVRGQQCFTFALADRIAEVASAKPKRRRERGRLHCKN
jgi:5-methylcytosine-specific restriction endonuclease McrA